MEVACSAFNRVGPLRPYTHWKAPPVTAHTQTGHWRPSSPSEKKFRAPGGTRVPRKLGFQERRLLANKVDRIKCPRTTPGLTNVRG
jgi:hypothetical protein